MNTRLANFSFCQASKDVKNNNKHPTINNNNYFKKKGFDKKTISYLKDSTLNDIYCHICL